MQPKVKRTGVCHMWHKLLANFLLCEAEAVVTVRVPGRVVDAETESTAVRTVAPAPAGEENGVCAGPEAVTRGA